MKRGLIYALASSVACIALAAWLVPYAPTPKAEGIGKIEVLTVADLFAEAIRRVHEERAMSDLYN